MHIPPNVEAISKALLSAAIAYSAHYSVAKVYNEFCVPDGLWGYFQGMITTGSPVCKVGMDIMSNTQVSYSTVIVMGVSRIILDWVAPGTSETACPAS
jgi:hypothetical protein